MRTLAIVAFSVVASIATSASAQLAGRVLLAAGEVSIVREGRVLTALAQTEIRAGDLLRTGAASSLQVKLADNALVALRPLTEFRIDEYRFAGSEDGTERAFFSLLKGGLRTITGLIGHKHPDSYRVSTPLVVISIRGTHYSAVICQADCPGAKNGVYGGVIEGRIAVVNQAKLERQFGAGEYFYAGDIRTPPERLLTPPDVLRDLLQSRARDWGRWASAPEAPAAIAVQAPLQATPAIGRPANERGVSALHSAAAAATSGSNGKSALAPGHAVDSVNLSAPRGGVGVGPLTAPPGQSLGHAPGVPNANAAHAKGPAAPPGLSLELSPAIIHGKGLGLGHRK